MLWRHGGLQQIIEDLGELAGTRRAALPPLPAPPSHKHPRALPEASQPGGGLFQVPEPDQPATSPSTGSGLFRGVLARSRKEDNKAVIDKAELRRMSQVERQELASLLAELDEPATHPVNPYLYDPALRRERRLTLVLLAGCCVILAGWIVGLAATLPHHFDAQHWRGVWVYFDVLLFAAFAATAWAIWRERQILIVLLVLVGTMLCCDAWFDVGTSLATSGIWISLLSAVFAELPLAFLAFAGARQLLRATVAAAILAGERAQDGMTAPTAERAQQAERTPAGMRSRIDACHSLRRTPLAGAGLDEALPRSRAERRAERAGQSA